MDIVNVAQKIEEKVKALELGRDILKEYAHNKANAIGEYEKKIAMTLIKLKNGVEFEIEGDKIKNPPISIMEKIVKGICFQEKINQELAEAQYKTAIVGMSAISSELNGYQSIFRHLEQKGVE